jgi:hypothetical protein
MLIYVGWKFDLNASNKVNILRIKMEKDPDIKYDISPRKFLLGSQKVNIGDEFDQNQIYFTRVIIGSGNKIANGDVNVLQILGVEKYNRMDKTLDVYMFGTPAARTIFFTDLFWKGDIYGIGGGESYEQLETVRKNLTKELKKHSVVNFENLTGFNFIFRIGTEGIN